MEALSLAANLVQLSKQFQSSDPNQAAQIKKAFKQQSFNDAARVIVYLMEVIGVRDTEFKRLQVENVELHELLKLNNIELDKGESNEESQEANSEANQTTEEIREGAEDGTK